MVKITKSKPKALNIKHVRTRYRRRVYRPQFLPIATERAIGDAFRGVKTIAEVRRKLQLLANDEGVWAAIAECIELRKAESKSDTKIAKAIRKAIQP
jgi:hypothetical protein